MRTGVDKQRRVPSLRVCACVRVRPCVGLPLALWFGEGCVKIMQMRNEFEIKDGLITPVLSIWLHLGGSMVNHVLPTGKKKRKHCSQWDSTLCSIAPFLFKWHCLLV